MKNSVKYFSVLLVILLLSACSEDILMENPPHIQTAETIYTSLDGFESGINGLYALVRQEREGLSQESTLVATLMMTGTDVIFSNSKSGLAEPSYNWDLNNPNANGYDDIFLWLYKTVNAANTIINRADNPKVDWKGDGNRDRVLAEARAIRAWAYRHLTYLWGDVPLNLEESSGSNIKTDFERTPIREVRRQMIADWSFAAAHLDSEPSSQGRMTRGVPMTYLAETYLALGMPDSALYWAELCDADPAYSLIVNRYGVNSSKPGVAFMDMFIPGNSDRSEGNMESLWTLQWELNVLGGGANLMRREIGGKYERWSYDADQMGRSRMANTEERGGKGLGYLLPNSYAIQLYLSSSEAARQDQRASDHALRRYFILDERDVISTTTNVYLGRPWQVGDTVWCAPLGGRSASDPTTAGGYNFYMLSDGRNKNDWPYSLKWAQADPGLPEAKAQHNDQVYMRLAETILLKAEALHRLERNEEAAAEINRLRDRANAKPVTADEISLDFILEERSRELLMEEHRRYTLLRFGGMVFYDRTNRYNYFYGLCENLTPRDSLLAIPQVVIDANLTVPMEQNPGF
jgi:hypothetical protein